MRRIVLWLCVFCLFGVRGKAQSFEVQQLLLDVQKLAQEKQLLSDLQKSYEVLSSGYTAIRDVAKGNFDLHKAFLDGLLAVSPVVRNYKRIQDIIDLQLQMMDSYQSAWPRFRQERHFTPDEIVVIGNSYAGLIDQTVKNLGTLATILTDGVLRASDAERLRQIDGLYQDMRNKWMSLQSLNNRTALLAAERASEQNGNDQLKNWYGLNK